jgi:lysophospholipase L1-like esterase
MLRSFMLTLGSIVITVMITLAADRAVAPLISAPTPPGQMQLLFPPGSEQTYATYDFEYTVRTNALGIREREITPVLEEGSRIIAIGDSYTYGWGVAEEETWVRRLEEQMRGAGYDVQTVNLGKPGTGPPDYANLAEEVIPLLRPDIVIVGMLQGNDLNAAGPEEAAPPTKRVASWMETLYPNSMRWLREQRRARDFDARTQDIEPPQRSTAEDNRRWTANTAKEFYDQMNEVDRARFEAFDDTVKQAFLTGNLNPYMIDLAMKSPNFYTLTFDLDDPWTQTCIRRAGSQFARIRHAAEENGAQVVVVSIPEGVYVNEEALVNMRRMGYDIPDDVIGSTAPDEGIRRACELAGLKFISVTDAFLAQRDNPDLFFELDGHLSPAGHALVGDTLAAKLMPGDNEVDTAP